MEPEESQASMVTTRKLGRGAGKWKEEQFGVGNLSLPVSLTRGVYRGVTGNG
jgi:hypothetical protein